MAALPTSPLPAGETFKMAFLPAFLHAGTGAVLGAVTLALLFSGRQVRPDGLVVAAGVAATFVCLATLWMVGHYTTTVGAEGIDGWDAWGQPHLVRWGDVTGVRPLTVVRLRYLRVVTPATVVWVPLDVDGPERLRGAIRRFAPEGSLVRRYFG